MKSYINSKRMSKVSLEALFEAIDKGFGICEIEPIMYVDLLKTGRNKRESMSYVERVTNALHELGIYHISDLIKTPKEKLFMGRLGLNSLTFLGKALMKMDQLGDCESIFKKDIYAGISPKVVQTEAVRLTDLEVAMEKFCNHYQNSHWFVKAFINRHKQKICVLTKNKVTFEKGWMGYPVDVRKFA